MILTLFMVDMQGVPPIPPLPVRSLPPAEPPPVASPSLPRPAPSPPLPGITYFDITMNTKRKSVVFFVIFNVFFFFIKVRAVLPLWCYENRPPSLMHAPLRYKW